MNFQKVVFAIVFFCQLLLQAKATLFNSSDGLLKSSMDTCTYSIALLDTFGDGWYGGNSATVRINNVNVLNGITFNDGIGPVYFNFGVTDLNSINVIFNPGPSFRSECVYAVNTGVGGTGSNVYSSLPFFYTLTNPCTSTCTYSARYFFNLGRTANYLSVYINKVIAQNISLSSTEFIKTVNFNVAKDDLIQFSMFYNYQGGPLNYQYTIYNSAGATGSILYTFEIAFTGPATPVSVSNYCSKSLYLILSSTANTTAQYLEPIIPLVVLPSVMTNFPMQINVTIVCGSISATQTRLTSSNEADPINFPIPANAFGSCYFFATSFDSLVPSFADSNQLIIQVSSSAFTYPIQDSYFLTDSSIPVLISTTSSKPLDFTVSVNCSNVFLDSFNVTTGIQTSYLLPTSAPLGTCTIYCSNDSGIYPISFTIKGLVTIVTPPSSPKLYVAAGSLVPILLSYDPVPSSSVSSFVSLACASTSTQSITGSTMNFPIPNNYFGNDCFFSVASTNYVLNNTVGIIVTQRLSFSFPSNNSVYTVSNSILVYVSTNAGSALLATVEVQMNCSSNGIAQKFNVITNTYHYYSSYSTNTYGICTMSVSSAPDYLIPINSQTFNLKYSLSISASRTIHINDNFSISINSFVALPSTISSVVLNLVCSGNIVQTWPTVTLNAVNILTTASNLVAATGCSFRTVSDQNLNTATLSFITVSQISLNLINPTANQQITINDTIPVLVRTNPTVTYTDSIGMRLQCGTNVTNFNVTTWQPLSYSYSDNFFGPCTVTIVSFPSYYRTVVGNSIVSFSLKYQLQFVDSPSAIYTGQEFNITIGTTYQPASFNQTNLELFCNDILAQSWTDLYLNTQLTLTVASELDPSTNCYFSTSADTKYFIQASNLGVILIPNPLQLAFIAPSDSITVISQEPISTLVTADLFPSSQFNLIGQLYCDSPASKSFSLTTGVTSDISYDSDFYGNCTMSIPSVPSYLIAPAPVSFIIKFNLTFATVPSVVYFGYSFVIEIDSSANPMPSTVSSVPLSLICDNQTVDSWDSVALNQPVNLPLTTVGLPSSDCQFVTTADTTKFINVSKENVTLSKATISISSPKSLDSLINPEPFDILLVVNEFPSKGVPVQVDLNCTGPGIEQAINVTTSVVYPYSYTVDTYGSCSLSILSTPTFYNVGSPVEFFIKYQLRFVDAPELVHIGSDFLIEIASSIMPLPEALNTTTTLALYCGTPSPQQVWTFVPLNEPVNLHLINNTVPSGDCKFVTESNPTAFNNTEIIVSISNSQIIDLIFTLPIPGVNITNPAAIETYLSVVDWPSLVVPVTAQISCSLSPDSPYNFTLDTSTLTNVLGYPSSFYGPCVMSVVEAPVDFIFPAPVSFNLNYSLSFVNAPSVINSGIMFTLLIGSSALNPTLSTSVVLICDNSTVDSWQNVAVGISVTLLAAPSLASNPQCSLTTRSENPFLTPATPVFVIIDRPVSPFGGDIVELTPEETQEFAQKLVFSGFSATD